MSINSKLLFILIILSLIPTATATQVLSNANLLPYNNVTNGTKGLINGNSTFGTTYSASDLYSIINLTSSAMGSMSLIGGNNTSQAGTSLREAYVTVGFRKRWITGINSFAITATVYSTGVGTTILGLYNYTSEHFESIGSTTNEDSLENITGTLSGSDYYSVNGSYVEFRVSIWTNGTSQRNIAVDCINVDYVAISNLPAITFISPTPANSTSNNLSFVYANISTDIGAVTGNLSWIDNFGRITNYSLTARGDLNYFRIVYAFQQDTNNTYQAIMYDQFGNENRSELRTVHIEYNDSIILDAGDAWLANGTTWAEDYYPIRSWSNLTGIVPTLAGMHVNTIEMLSIWEPISPDNPYFRWGTQNYAIDTTRGTEAEFNTFVSTAHSYGIKVVPIMLFITTFAPDNRCSGRLLHKHFLNRSNDPPTHEIKNATARYDSEGLGGALYQYQIANPTKNLLINSTAVNDYACVWSGNGLLTDTDSQDTIDYFAGIYQTQILDRNLDGVRFDVPIFRNCVENEPFFNGNWEMTCFDPVVGKHSPWPLMRKIYSMKKPGDIILSEAWDTGVAFRNNSQYPDFYYDFDDEWLEDTENLTSFYDPYTDVDEVATASEGYEYIREVKLNIYNNASAKSSDYVNWILGQPISYDRTRFRMIRNWNGFSAIFSRIVASMQTYYPSTTLEITSPGVPKITDYEVYGSGEKEWYLINKTINQMAYCKANYELEPANWTICNRTYVKGGLPVDWVVTNPVETRRSHLSNLTAIRANHTSLDAKNYNMADALVGTSPQVIAFNRWNTSGDKLTIITNFANTTKNITVNTLIASGAASAIDLLTGTIYTGDGDNFSISVPANGSIILSEIEPTSFVSLDNWTFDLKNSAYIRIPYLFNATTFTNAIAGELQFRLNGSIIQWRTNTNKTITNIHYNNVSDVYSFNASGINGYLNMSVTMKNISAPYYLYINGMNTANLTSSLTGEVNYKYTGGWSDHEFILNSTYIPVIFINTTPVISNVANLSCGIDYCPITFDVNQSNAITQIRYSTDMSLSSNTVNQTTGTSRTTNITGLTNNMTYYYSVWAWNSTSAAYYSNSTIHNFTTSQIYLKLSGTVTPLWSSISATGQPTLTGGGYDFGQVFETGKSYWINISKFGYTPNNTLITFALSDIVWNINLPIIPAITATNFTWWNSITNNTQLIVHVSNGAQFRLIFSNIITSEWKQDGVTLSETSPNLTTSFITNGHHNITGQGVTLTGITPLVSWSILKTRAMSDANDVLDPLDTSGLDALKVAMSSDTGSFQAFFTALMTPYTNPLGSAFFIFLYVLPLVVIWVRQEKALIPVGLMLIFGGLLSSALPVSWILPARIILAATTLGILVSIFKERG